MHVSFHAKHTHAHTNTENNLSVMKTGIISRMWQTCKTWIWIQNYAIGCSPKYDEWQT